jgi:hypothetical protein
MTVTRSSGLVVTPYLLCDTGCGPSLIDVKARFTLSLSSLSFDSLKIFIYFYSGEVRVKPSTISKIYHWDGQTLCTNPDFLRDKTGLTSKVPFFDRILTLRGAQTLLVY